jgi:hypothetical protein
MHTHAHMHTHTHTYTHTQTHTHKHTHTHKVTLPVTHGRAHTRTNAQTHAHTSTHARTHANVHAHTDVHTQLHTRIQHAGQFATTRVETIEGSALLTWLEHNFSAQCRGQAKPSFMQHATRLLHQEPHQITPAIQCLMVHARHCRFRQHRPAICETHDTKRNMRSNTCH